MNQTLYKISRVFIEKIRSVSNFMGYEIRKFPRTKFPPIKVFDIAVQLLMHSKRAGDTFNFIQVGANDGLFGDPLRKYILKNNWHGVLIEPQPDVFQRLIQNYDSCKDRLIFLNVAISGGGEKIKMYRVNDAYNPDAPYELSVSSADRLKTANQLGVNKSALKVFDIDVMTLKDVILASKMSTVDLLQIDTEGFDLEVLKTLDLSLCKPNIIQFEHGHFSTSQCEEIAILLSANGYEIYWGGHENDSLAIQPSVYKLQ